MSHSEIARLRQDIELTCQSLNQGLTGFAITSKHAIINHKYRQLGQYQEQLERLVGQEQAIELMVETYNRVVK